MYNLVILLHACKSVQYPGKRDYKVVQCTLTVLSYMLVMRIHENSLPVYVACRMPCSAKKET